MLQVQHSENQHSLRGKIAQRRRDLNMTGDTTIAAETIPPDDSKSLENSRLMTSIAKRREIRKQTLDQSFSKPEIEEIQTIPSRDTEEDPKSASMNLSTSIRFRLKEQARKSQDTALQEEPTRKLRGLRAREQQTRFDVVESGGESRESESVREVSEEVSKKSSSVRWKVASKRSALDLHEEEEVDEYSFFTKVYTPATESRASESRAVVAPTTETADDTLTQFDDVYVVARPQMKSSVPTGRTFYPSTSTVEPTTLHGGLPCFLEDEGIYVGEPPSVNTSNWNKMENRLLQTEAGRKWFGIDGSMIVTPDPLKQISSRPLINFDVDPSLQQNAKCIASQGKFIGHSTVNQLSVSVSQLEFTHHPLFSKEHVLVAQLRELYSRFLVQERQNLAQHLDARLQSLRDAVQELRDTLGPKPWDMSKQFNRECGENMGEYLEEIRRVRELANVEWFKGKQLLRSILTLWREVKGVRESSGYTTTNLQLLVYKREGDYAAEDREWQRRVKQTFTERKEELMAGWDVEQGRYRNELAGWKMQVKELKKRQKEGKQEVLELPPKPAAPVKPKMDQLLDEIQCEDMRCRKIPGDPIVSLEIAHSVLITPTEECPLPEQKRRKEIQKSVYYGKLFYNNSEVTKTPPTPLSSEFTVSFAENVCMQVIHWPESIKFELWSSSEKLSDIYLEIPSNDRHTGCVEVDKFEFSSNQKVSHTGTSGVGSGVLCEEKIYVTSGKLACSAAWVRDQEGKVLAPAQKGVGSRFGRADPIHSIGVKSLNDMEKVSQWISDAKLDPNDPRNAPLLHLMNRARTGGPSEVKYFRLNHLEQQTYFASSSDIDSNRRFQLLSLRNQGVPEYKPLKMVPLYQSEMTNFEFRQVEKEGEKVLVKEEGDVFDQQRSAVSKFLKEVQEKIASRSRQVRVSHELSDVVMEEQVPDISTLGKSIARLLEPRHPLRPQRKERKKVTNQAVGITSVSLMINISQAQGLPIRRRATSDTQISEAGFARSAVMLRPFVEVSFQRQSRVTHVADGPNPHWNQELLLPLNVINNDFSAVNLRQVSDEVYFNVFDEVIVDILEDNRLRETNIHQRLERRWLGSFSIPFSTIYINSRVEGKFRLNVPHALIGYNKDHSQQPQLLADAASLVSLTSAPADRNSYLSIFITVEPPLAPQPPLREAFNSNEDTRLIRASEVWEEKLKQRFPNRSFRTLVTDVNGKQIFVTRFITPQNPPSSLIPAERGPTMSSLPVMKQVAKFVSRIPYYQDSIAFSGSCDIWITSDWFLKMLTGDEEEHAVLLCNFFLFMGIDAYVVVGVGVPEGKTCYVLTNQLDGAILWNPSTGQDHPQKKPYHSLVTVSYLFNHENIWANVQNVDDPPRLSFNLINRKCWEPFFSKTSPKLSTVQQSRLEYPETNLEAVQALESNLEKMLMDKIMEWRDRHVTRWNRHCRALMRRVLPLLEAGNLSEEEEQASLSDLLSSHNVTGFPMNMRYTDASTIVESVFSTNVHVAEDPTVEFALTVYIHPYPNNVLSVWIYVATLQKKY